MRPLTFGAYRAAFDCFLVRGNRLRKQKLFRDFGSFAFHILPPVLVGTYPGDLVDLRGAVIDDRVEGLLDELLAYGARVIALRRQEAQAHRREPPLAALSLRGACAASGSGLGPGAAAQRLECESLSHHIALISNSLSLAANGPTVRLRLRLRLRLRGSGSGSGSARAVCDDHRIRRATPASFNSCCSEPAAHAPHRPAFETAVCEAGPHKPSQRTPALYSQPFQLWSHRCFETS